MKVGFQGIDGSYSSIVTKQIFPNEQYLTFKSFDDVLKAIVENEIDYGVLPIENSYAGRVARMHYLFKDFCDKNLFIIMEKMIKIEHCLCGINGSKIEEITRIFSHEQALMQCKTNIAKFLPHALCVAKENTAIASKFVSESKNKNFSAICSKDACKKYGLQVLQENFQDINDNYTLFVVLSKKQNTIVKNSQNVLTSALFEIKNKPGALQLALKCFADQDIDLVKIESHIPMISSRSAMFFITIKGNIADNSMQIALNNLKNFTTNIHILGSYFSNRV